MTHADDEQAALVKDLVHASLNPPAEFSMDDQVKLLAEERECANMVKWWTERQKQIQDRIKELMGDNTVGKVDGQEAVFFQYQSRFNSTAFQKKYPNLYRTYSRLVTEERFDPEWLRTQRPDLYREFQVRAFRNTYEAPGA